MLREIRSPFLKPRIIPFKVTTAANVATIGNGIGDITATSDATGKAVVSVSRAFARRPIVVANASSADVAAGGYVAGVTNTFPAATGTTLYTYDTSASGDDGSMYGIMLGYDMKDATRYGRRANVLRARRTKSAMIAFQVNTASSGTIVIGTKSASLVRNGTGDITLTFKPAFSNNAVSAIATPVSATAAVAMVASTDATSVRVKIFSTAGVAADGIVNIIVVGNYSMTGSCEHYAPVSSRQRKAIILGYSIVYASGAPGVDFNSGSATLTDTATGRCTFTFAQKFARETIICAMPIANAATRYCTIDNSASTGFEVKNWSSAPALADPSDTAGFQVIGLGFDDACEY